MIGSYQILNVIPIDVSECIWPIYEQSVGECFFPLPKTYLNKSYSFLVGRSNAIDKYHTLIPFYQCQDANFNISAVETLTQRQPYWLSIDQQAQSITINTQMISSVFTINLVLSARLFTISDDVSKITTDTSVSFSFTNDNCYLLSSNCSYYIVLNKITELQFEFGDNEDDNVKLKVSTSQYFGSFVKYDSSTTATVMLMSETTQSSPVEFSFMYTDSYHQSDADWQQFTTMIYLFASEPPYFTDSLSSVHANRCADIKLVLPDFVDPNNQTVTLLLSNDAPDWVSISNNSILQVLSSSLPDNNSEFIDITIILENESKAWRNYTINIIIDSIFKPLFSMISNITYEELLNDRVKIDVFVKSRVDVIDCYSNKLVPWLIFNNSFLRFDSGFSKFSIYTSECIKLCSIDSCNNKICSNQFWIVSDILTKPPLLLNSIGPFDIPKGKYSLFKIPEDMFIDLNGDKLKYDAKVIKCSQLKLFNTGIIEMKNEKLNYIFAYSNFTINCKVSVTATNTDNLMSEAIVEFNVYQCASK